MRAYCKGATPISLKKTLKSVCQNVHCSFETDVKTQGCVSDPEEVWPGGVFFVLCSPEEAVEAVGIAIYRGCSAIVADRPILGAETVPFFVVPNVREAFGVCCQAIYDYPAKSLKVIGITGTSGKTTTSYLISGILSEAGYETGLIGSLGIFDGQLYHAAEDTTPTPDKLAAWLHRIVENGCTHVIIEASSQAIAEARLAGIKFDAVCVTNIRRDHLDYHQTVEQYRRAKLNVFKYAKKKALAVCNIDDRITEAILPLIDHPLLTVGIRNQAEVNAVLVERFRSEQTFIVTAGTDAVPFRTTTIGDEFIYNCLTATAIGIGLEIDLKTIARGIERVESVPGRMERIECGQNFGVFIDSARTADSLSAVLRTVREVTEGRLFCVFGAAAHLESAKRQTLGKAIDSLADHVVLTSASDRLDSETAATICDIGKGFASSGGVRIMPDRAEAIAWALSEAGLNDSVLIVGKGENELHFPDAPPFCDRLFAKQWLYENHAEEYTMM